MPQMVPGPLGMVRVSGTNHDGTDIWAELDYNPANGAITGGSTHNGSSTASNMLVTVNNVVRKVAMPSGDRTFTPAQINAAAGVTNLSQIDDFSMEII